MSARFLGPTVVALILALPVAAFGQGATAPAATPTTASTPRAPTGGPLPSGGATGARASSDTAAPAAPRPPAREATGYAPESIRSAADGSAGSRPLVRASGKNVKPRVSTEKSSQSRKGQTGASVVEPGFELLASGGSRFYVELGQAVPIEQRKAKGSITFVLKGARNTFRNNLNPLVTEHFNTPVRRAKLQRAGRDLLFVMELRQDVAATHQIVTNKEGHAVLQVDFGAGTFVRDAAAPIPESAAETAGESTTDSAPAGAGVGVGVGAGRAGQGNRAGPKP